MISYHYMFFSLLLLSVSLILWWMSGKLRQTVLLSGLLSAPFGFLSVFFVPQYWDPVRVVEFGAGFEDLFFSFASGGITWFCASYPFRTRLQLQLSIQRVMLVYVGVSMSGMFLGFLLDLAGVGPMTITYLAFVTVVFSLLLIKPRLWRLSLAGLIGFGIFYTLFCLAVFTIDPEFIYQWNIKALSGYTFFCIPLEELAWSFGFGAVWPLIVGLCFDVQITAVRNRE